MRKSLLVVLLVLLTALCTTALAAADRSEYSLSPLPAVVSLKTSRTIVTSDNLGEHPELLTVLGISKDEILADWASRGVILTSWADVGKKKYSCVEISAMKDESAAQYPDMLWSTDKALWKEYENSYKNSEAWTGLGYTFQKIEQKTAEGRYYLLLKYKQSAYNGYMARTTWKGYTVVFDFRVYNQAPSDQVAKDLYYLIRTFTESAGSTVESASGTPGDAEETAGIPAGSDAEPAVTAAPASVSDVKLEITQEPPLEANENSFTVEGVTEPGMHLIAVLMRLGSDEAQQFETDANAKNGTFKIKITMPEENIWLVTLNAVDGDKVVAEKVFNTTTYKKTLIPVTFDSEVPEEVFADELVIAGTTMKAVDVQCIATNSSGKTVFDKKSHPNGTGRFTFKIPVKEEDVYEIAVIITKKGYDTKRFSYTVSRFLTEDARKELLRKQAQNVGYGTLSARIDQYVGKTLKFNVWIVSIEEIGDEWHILAAGSLTGEDHYTQQLMYIAEQEPSFSVGEKLTLYGTCTGPHYIESEESTESVPQLDLLFWD